MGIGACGGGKTHGCDDDPSHGILDEAEVLLVRVSCILAFRRERHWPAKPRKRRPAAGRLVRPFDHALKAVSSFYLVYPPEAIRQRKVKAFRDWLLEEIGPPDGPMR
ncbi:hypothetical protein ACWGS9_05000 [Bradyrhizobium sp. Arg314]